MGALPAPARVEPGAVDAGEDAAKIGDGRNECGPGLGLGVLIGAIVAARVEPQGSQIGELRDGASAQIGFGERAAKRLRHREQTARRFRRALRRRLPRRRARRDVRLRQAEEHAGFVEHVAQAIEMAIARNEIEKITMLAGGGVRPFAGSAFAAVRTCETDKQAAAGRGWRRRRPANSGLACCRWKDNGGRRFPHSVPALREIRGWTERVHVTRFCRSRPTSG